MDDEDVPTGLDEVTENPNTDALVSLSLDIVELVLVSVEVAKEKLGILVSLVFVDVAENPKLGNLVSLEVEDNPNEGAVLVSAEGLLDWKILRGSRGALNLGKDDRGRGVLSGSSVASSPTAALGRLRARFILPVPACRTGILDMSISDATI